MKALTYVAGAAVAAMFAVAATPSHAAVDANGSFGFIPSGTVTLDTGDITAATSEKTYPATLSVNTVAANFLGNPNNLPIALGDAPTISINPIPIDSGAVNFNVDINGLTFSFTNAVLKNLIPSSDAPGFIATQFNGTLSADTTSTFNLGTPAILAQNCNQSQTGAVVNCSDTLSVSPNLVPVPEPASLALLGSALFGFGLLRRRKA